MKLSDEDLLDILTRKEDQAGNYIYGQLASEREKSLREYYRMPYGNEEDGWSQIVSSDIQDTVEWILPSLLKIFTATDKVVSFEPTKAEDVKACEQATEACNYVFTKQNNGFLISYTAFKDMLIVRNCAVHWRKETTPTVSSEPFKGATEEMLALLTQDKDVEIEAIEESAAIDELGQPVRVFNGRLKRTESRTICKVETFNPEDLLIDRNWTSPLLDNCPYVCRMYQVTLSELHMMGFKDVTAEELKSSMMTGGADKDFRVGKITRPESVFNTDIEESEDDAMAEGWLRIEYVLADTDGDGIAERLCVYRLKDKILKREVTSHVPIATGSPMLNTHRWDGMSMADAVSDLQSLHTELLRQTLNNLYLTNNPRTKVLTDSNWAPMANIDDLLDSRAGGVIRQRSVDAVTEQVTPFAAGASMPMLEYVQGMRENRTGVTRYNQGLDANTLNKTAAGVNQIMTASQQRIELIARIIAETLYKPVFAGILKLLTDGGMEKMAFRLRNEFVEYDPNEWRDHYDMTINVGLGTGDKAQQAAHLTSIYQMQQAGMAMGMADPTHLYHTMTKLVENAGYKDVQNFLKDPSNNPPQPQQPPLPLVLEQVKQQGAMNEAQLKAQLEDQKNQREVERDMLVAKNEQEMQARQDTIRQQIEAERDVQKAAIQAQEAERQREFERWKAELQSNTQIYIKQLSEGKTPEDMAQEKSENDAMQSALMGIQNALELLSRPKVGTLSNGKQIRIDTI